MHASHACTGCSIIPGIADIGDARWTSVRSRDPVRNRCRMPLVQLVFDFAAACDTQACASDALGANALPRLRPLARVRSRSKPRKTMNDIGQLFEPMESSPATAGASCEPRRCRRGPRGINHGTPMQARFDEIVELMLARYGLRVRKWRTSLSGVAVLRMYRDGREERWIESPYPTSPLRLAIFLHEVGHHAIGLGIYKPRCLEEFLAWRFSIEHLEQLGIATEGVVARRFDASMRYAVAKAIRRGIRQLPAQLAPFVPTGLLRQSA